MKKQFRSTHLRFEDVAYRTQALIDSAWKGAQAVYPWYNHTLLNKVFSKTHIVNDHKIP